MILISEEERDSRDARAMSIGVLLHEYRRVAHPIMEPE
jgi:hypothetical protein